MDKQTQNTIEKCYAIISHWPDCVSDWERKFIDSLFVGAVAWHSLRSISPKQAAILGRISARLSKMEVSK